VPRAHAPAHAGPASLQAAGAADLHRRQSGGGAAHQSERTLRDTEQKYGLPTVDPLRTGVGRIVDALAKM
jgi:hypothetical protein